MAIFLVVLMVDKSVSLMADDLAGEKVVKSDDLLVFLMVCYLVVVKVAVMVVLMVDVKGEKLVVLMAEQMVEIADNAKAA